jgi:hypothetical protein
MDREQQIAYINSQIVCAMAEIEGMKANNKMREDRQEALAYGENDFIDIPAKYSLDHNSVIKLFHNL